MITEDQAEDALADMGDVSDILSAFEEDAEVDPYLEALSASLEDVEIRELARMTRRIRAALQEKRARRQGRRVVA
jgi:dihydropteroate synthase